MQKKESLKKTFNDVIGGPAQCRTACPDSLLLQLIRDFSTVGRVKERKLEEGEKGRREHCVINLCVQNSHKFAQNKCHTGVCDILCKFENIMF